MMGNLRQSKCPGSVLPSNTSEAPSAFSLFTFEESAQSVKCGGNAAEPLLEWQSGGPEREEVLNISKFTPLTNSVVLPHSQLSPHSGKAEAQTKRKTEVMLLNLPRFL